MLARDVSGNTWADALHASPLSWLCLLVPMEGGLARLYRNLASSACVCVKTCIGHISTIHAIWEKKHVYTRLNASAAEMG